MPKEASARPGAAARPSNSTGAKPTILEMNMHATRIDLPPETLARSISLLQAALADAIDLRLSTKQAHWTVRDPNFKQLHELFDDFVETLDEEIDEMAERIAALGGVPDGRTRSVARLSELADYPIEACRGAAHLSALSDRLAILANKVRRSIDGAEGAGDAATADLMTASVRRLDQMMWFIEAHLDA